MSVARTVAALGLAFVLCVAAPAHAGGWEPIYEEAGIAVSRMTVEGSPFVGFRGEGVIDAELGRILYVITDTEHRTEWVDRLYLQDVLEKPAPNETVLYQAYELPPPFANRDFVIHGKMLHDPGTGVVTLELRSIEHPKAPPTAGVRAQVKDSRYTLTPLGPKQTRVAVEIQSDPGGWMPAWLMNLIQRSWPVETLQGIEEQLDKDWVGVRDPSGAPAPG